MTTKAKSKNKKRLNPKDKESHPNRQTKSIDSRDLNEDDQHLITNFQYEEYLDESRVEDSSSNRDNREDENPPSVEEEEDREQIRKEEDAQGKEQV